MRRIAPPRRRAQQGREIAVDERQRLFPGEVAVVAKVLGRHHRLGAPRLANWRAASCPAPPFSRAGMFKASRNARLRLVEGRASKAARSSGRSMSSPASSDVITV